MCLDDPFSLLFGLAAGLLLRFTSGGASGRRRPRNPTGRRPRKKGRRIS